MTIQSKGYLAANGELFAWSLILPGVVYGHKNQLINDTGKSLVEIYDYDTRQVIICYYLETILESDSRKFGICLHGGIPQYTIDASTWQAMLADIVKA